MQHRCVIRGIERSEARSQRSNSLIAIHFKTEDLYCQRISRLRPFDIKRPGQRIVPGCHAQCVPGLPDRIAKAVERIGVQDVSRLQSRDRLRRRIHVLHIVDGPLILHDIALRDRRRADREHPDT